MLTTPFALLLALQVAKPPLAVGPLAAQGRLVSYRRGSGPSVMVPFRYTARVGDVVEVGSGCRATLFMRSNGKRYTFESGAKVRIAESQAVVLAGPAPKMLLLSPTSTDPTSAKRLTMSTTVRGGDRRMEPYGAVRESSITLHWSADPTTSKLSLELLSLDGKHLSSFSIESTATWFIIPAATIPAGTWMNARLKVEYSDRPTIVRETLVRSLSESERAGLKASEAKIATNKVALGAEYEWTRAEVLATLGLVAEMEKAWQEGLKPHGLSTDSATAQRALGELYETAGFRIEALAAYQLAVQAGDTDPDLSATIKRLSLANSEIPSRKS